MTTQPTAHTASDDPHVTSVRTNLIVFAILMGLLLVTVAVAFLDLGPIGLTIALVIASVKAVLIVLFFMHALHGSRLQFLFAFAAFFWLAIMIAFMATDYYGRVALPLPGK